MVVAVGVARGEPVERMFLIAASLAVAAIPEGLPTVICSDKTGTLTQNRMQVERVWTPTGNYRVAGLAEAAESGLRLLGLVAIADPPRAETAAAVAACRGAGVTLVMISGAREADHPPAVLKVPSDTGLMALLHRPRFEQAGLLGG